MLKEIVETLLHFATAPSFQATVAANGFYPPDVYTKGSICRRNNLLSHAQLDAFETFAVVVDAQNVALALKK